MKTEMLWIVAGAALIGLVWSSRRYSAAAMKSPHCAGKCTGTTVPGYWADVL